MSSRTFKSGAASSAKPDPIWNGKTLLLAIVVVGFLVPKFWHFLGVG